MKKRMVDVKAKKIIHIIMAIMLLAILSSMSATALSDEGSDVLSGYTEAFGGDGGESAEEAAESIREGFTLQRFVTLCTDALRKHFFSYLPYFCGLLLIVILTGVYTAVRESMKGSEIADSICNLALCSYTILLISPLCENIELICREMCAFMLAALPSVTALYGSAVGVSTAAVSYSGTVTSLGMIQGAVTLIIIPAARAVLVLSCVSAMTRYMDMSGFCAFIKGTLMWILGILVSLISAVMYFQTALSATADNLSVRSMRFAAQSAIPIVGGVVSESLRVVTESLRLVKSVCGITGIMTLLCLVLPPVALIAVYRLFFSFSSAVAGMLGARRMQAFIKDMSGVINILLAAVVAVVFVLIIILGIFIKTGVQ